MTDSDGTHRAFHTHGPDSVSVREADAVESDEGMMELRLPVASTGEVRNEGDDPLSGAELRAFERQIDSLTRGVFPEHGMSDAVDREHYSQLEKLGYWADATIEREASSDDEDVLVATARMPDPETLPAATGDYREALAILKEQALRGVPIAASIAWRDDEARDAGVDLMEVSIVGIGADPRTTSEGGEALVARAAVEAGADPEALVETVRAATQDADTDGERPFGTPQSPNLWDSFEECVADVEDWDGVDDAEAFCGWAKDQTEGQAAGDADHDQTVTDDDTDPPADDAGDTTDSEQAGGDAEQTRAPEDVTEDDLLTFTAMHFDGMDEGDLAEAVDAADAEYIGECDAEALFDFVSIVTGAEYGAVEDAMGDLMADAEADEEQGDYGDGEDDDEMDDDDDDRSAEGDTADGERDADADGDTDERDLHERLDSLESDIEALRSGEIEVDTPGDDDAEERDADGDDTDGTDPDAQRDTTDPAAPPEWAE